MTVKEIQDKLNYFPEHVEVFCDGHAVVSILRKLNEDNVVECVELVQE